MSDESPETSSKPSTPIRARRWQRPSSDPVRPRPYRFGLRLIGIPAAAVAGVLLYRGLRPHLVLPECDSQDGKDALSRVLEQYGLAPARYEPIKTVSSGKEEVVCSAVLPLPDGGSVAVDYKFYWQGTTAHMEYKLTPPHASPATPTPPTR